jgi:hypothetical protein
MSAAPISKGCAGLLAWHTVRNPHRHGDSPRTSQGAIKLSRSASLLSSPSRRHTHMRRWQTGVTFAYEWRACRARCFAGGHSGGHAGAARSGTST